MKAINCEDYLQSIHNINLSYLILAQQLIREDKISAGFRLGLPEETIEFLKELTLPQLIKLSASSQLICRLRLDDEKVMSCLTRDSRIDALQQIHTGILLSTDLLNVMNEQEKQENNGAISNV